MLNIESEGMVEGFFPANICSVHL